MKKVNKISLMILGLGFMLGISTANAQEFSTESILQTYVKSYVNDPMALSATFGIKVADDWWTVSVERVEEPYKVGKKKQYTFHKFGPHNVTLQTGKPEIPTWYFNFVDRPTLDKINNQVWTASTATAKSTPADIVTLDILDMEGFQTSQQASAKAYQALEHFWKRDVGEVTRFNRDGSLPSHGAEIVALYTMKDKRINWFSLGTQEVANGDRGLDKGQVPNLFIITNGKGKAQIGDEEMDLEPGMSVFVGPYVKHVLYNPYEEPLEGILILFGDNIDYAKGQSYIEFLEKEYEFYRVNEIATKKESNQ